MVKADTPSSNWSSSKTVALSCDVRVGRWQERIVIPYVGFAMLDRVRAEAASGGCLICWLRASRHDASGGDTWPTSGVLAPPVAALPGTGRRLRPGQVFKDGFALYLGGGTRGKDAVHVVHQDFFLLHLSNVEEGHVPDDLAPTVLDR